MPSVIRFSFARATAIMMKELRQLARDRITFAMIIMIPFVQLILFGYAINTDVRHVPAGILDFAATSQTRALVQDLEASQVVRFIQRYDDLKQAEAAITNGEVAAVLYLPADFERRWLASELNLSTAPVGQWITDGSDPVLSGAVSSLRQMPLLDPRAVPDHDASRVVLETVNYFNPEKRSAVNIVPGLIAVILTMTMILFTSAAIVREREQGNMEFLITTPIRPIELMLGKIMPYILVGLLQTLIILALGNRLFAVPLPADLFSLLVITLLFILASLTLGLMISTQAQTQLQAMQMTIFILLPSILLSGFMFPFAAMPEPAQWLSELLPATHYVRMIRAVVLREAHWSDLQFDVGYLLGFILVGMTLATLRFKKRLD